MARLVILLFLGNITAASAFFFNRSELAHKMCVVK